MVQPAPSLYASRPVYALHAEHRHRPGDRGAVIALRLRLALDHRGHHRYVKETRRGHLPLGHFAGRSARSGSAPRCAIGGVVFITLLGIPIALGIWLGAGLWATYRIVRGWLALRDRRLVP